MLKHNHLIVLCLFIVSCVAADENNRYTLIEPGNISIGNINIDNPGYWSQQKINTTISWTKDGVLLNEIVFGKILPGQHILNQRSDQNINFSYDPSMSLNLIVEQFNDALSISNYHNVKLHQRKKKNINNSPAIQFKISYDTTAGVNYSAWVLFVKSENKLLTLFCSATSRHYFLMLEKVYLKLIDSVKLL